MRQFFKFMFASMLGLLLALLLFVFIVGGIISTIVSSVSSEKTTVISDNSVLEISLDYPVTERTSKNPFQNLDFNTMKSRSQLGLNDIIKNIKKAAADSKIKGIYLHVSTITAGFATIEEIRNALADFKKSGKFITAYAENYSQGAYYLASIADKVYLNPQGEIDFKGLRAELVFFKGAFEKVGIEPEVIRHGKFKSAVEPFINDKMSDENRKQLADVIDDLWDHMITGISDSRKITKETLLKLANDYIANEASEAFNEKLVDGLKYEDEVVNEIKSKAGISEKDKLATVTMSKYNHTPENKSTRGFVKEKIAVIYASGEIESGTGEENSIGSETFAEAIGKARKDENVKAIVLRVNSPGGSALASEVIWREVALAKKVKPVVVSMGDLAASGGYYISCGADSILAQENTITGSIGVFGLMFNGQKLMNEKLGLTTDTYKTSQYADIGTFSRPLTEGEKNIMQKSVEKVYATFTGRVSEGRKIALAQVDSIGQGRIWSGLDALRLGLVDRIGGIDEAIKVAARMAKTENYRIYALPEQKEPIEELLSNIKDETQATLVKNELGEAYPHYKNLKTIIKLKGIQARIPFEFSAE